MGGEAEESFGHGRPEDGLGSARWVGGILKSRRARCRHGGASWTGERGVWGEHVFRVLLRGMLVGIAA